MSQLRETIIVGVVLIGLAVAAVSLAKCAPAESPVEAHAKRLTECIAEGKDAGSRAVYTRCADEADLRYGLRDGGP